MSWYPQINWDQPAEAIHNWIRGNDKVPGAWTEACGQVCFHEAEDSVCLHPASWNTAH